MQACDHSSLLRLSTCPSPDFTSDLLCALPYLRVSQMALIVKKPPANAGDIRDVSSIPEWVGKIGGENGKKLQYSCLEKPTDRGALWVQSIGLQTVRHN